MENNGLMDVIFALEDINNIAKNFIPLLGKCRVIAVNGQMGTGKTTLIHAVCRQMKVMDNMSSPTYSIIQQYKTQDDVVINHIDVYRLRDLEEAVNAGVGAAINSGDFCFIEWPEKIMNILPLHFITIFIKAADQNRRQLIVKY